MSHSTDTSHPPYFPARLQKPAHDMNNAPHRCWNNLDLALRNCSMVPERVNGCFHVLACAHLVQGAIAQQNGMKETFTERRWVSEMEAAFAKNAGSHSWKSSCRKNPWQRNSNLFVDCFGDKWKRNGTACSGHILTFVQKIGRMM